MTTLSTNPLARLHDVALQAGTVCLPGRAGGNPLVLERIAESLSSTALLD